MRSIADNGAKEGFYNNYIGEAIVAACREYGGVLTLDDLDAHYTRDVEPIRTMYKGKWVYECPPPTHGLAALLALNQLTELENTLSTTVSGDIASQVHVELEVMRGAFVDALQYVGDHTSSEEAAQAVLLRELLSKEHAAKRVANINLEAISTNLLEAVRVKGRELPLPPQQDTAAAYKQSDTVYFCVVDKEGNGCSFINSNYMGFGTGIVPKGCGFTLHNRGHNFSLDPAHLNCLAPRKRCYHTIIPALLTSVKPDSDNGEEELFATMGVMGGFMQPQGHVQVIRHMLERGLDPQEALDRPRWQVVQVDNSNEGLKGLSTSSHVIIETGYGEAYTAASAPAAAPVAADAASYFSSGSDIPVDDAADNVTSTNELVEKLRVMGHDVKVISNTAGRLAFGKGQIITRNAASGCLTAGSDPRADGCAIPAFM
jgi:gamma-glutamyltranspeptidase / glutathione hydrolase